MISKQEVEHIAKLARLDLSEKEVKKMQKDLSSILDYFDLLKRAPKVKKDKANFKGLEALRKDEAIPSHGTASNLITQAPDKKDGYIKVKSIL